jgi:hypothetical protein
MKQTVSIIIIVGLILGLVFQTVRLMTLSDDNKILKDSLQTVSTDLKYCDADFHFDKITCRTICKNRVVKLGDSLVFDVGLLGGNSVYSGNDKREPLVILGTGIDSSYQLLGAYDTIQTKDWTARLHIKTNKLGLDTIYGQYFTPYKDYFHSYPFVLTYYTYKDDLDNTIILDTIKYGW